MSAASADVGWISYAVATPAASGSPDASVKSPHVEEWRWLADSSQESRASRSMGSVRIGRVRTDACMAVSSGRSVIPLCGRLCVVPPKSWRVSYAASGLVLDSLIS